MGAPKLKQFPKKKKLSDEEQHKLIEKNRIDKEQIEQLKRILNEKIKNPDIAKRAARILEELIKK